MDVWRLEEGDDDDGEDLTVSPKVDEIRRTLVVDGTVPTVRLRLGSGMRLRFIGLSDDEGSEWCCEGRF